MPEAGTDILANLRRDHRNTLALLDALQSEIERIVQGKGADYNLLSMILDYLINYPDLYHHAEETALFLSIKKHNTSLSQLVDQLLNEHKDMGMLSRRIAAALHNLRRGSGDSVQHLQKLVDRYVSSQREHMIREERLYFPLLERAFTAEEWEKVHEDLAKISDPLFGNTVRQSYIDRYKNIMKLVWASKG